jgi:hypothetical protein
MKACFIEKHQPTLFKLSLLVCFLFVSSFAYSQTVDCSVAANCTNDYCNFAANIEKGCRCFDGLDNDGDGKIDKADSNCATYYGLSFVGEGSDCSIVPPGANTPFDLVNAPITSSQNTADTQSKVSVGDVDGDGKPDAVITSKWNSEIRVVATIGGQADGTQAGAVKSSFNLSGNTANQLLPNNGYGNGACKPDRLLFEHENLIADIDGNGKAEMFGIISNRSGNPSTPPTCFYLAGFKYKSGTLEPLFSPAIAIGTDRPGTFGIADMDGDGKAEIYLRDRIYAAETGALLADAGGNWDLDVTSAPVAVNITGDNKMELVSGTKIYSIPTLTNRNPATPGALTLIPNGDMNAIGTDDAYVKLTTDPVEYGVDTHSSCSVADIDKDGVVDIIISGALNDVSGPTTVFYWNYAKNRVTMFSPPDATYPNGWPWGTGRVNIGDADGDGLPNLTFISGNRLWCMKVDQTTGVLSNQWANFRTINDTRSGVLTVTIYDFDNDGDPEVVYRDSQQLAVIDGVGGTTLEWSAVCQSHTYTEGPIIADVNGDGGTDICVACNTSNSFDIEDPIQQQALGQFRLYYSSGNEWLPTRKVWNQPGYFVVNINDDLTLPFPQLDQNLVFGTANCPNGLPGPQMPMNVFLNQVPYLSANGCPVFPAPDLSYVGDDPDSGVDTNGDGVYTPTVEVIPPICGNLGIQVRFNIINDGDLPISGNIPVSFFKADPTLGTTTQADKLHSSTIALTNLAVDATYTTPWVTFNGTGGTFRLYIVLNNSGATLPIVLTGSSTTECRIDNNLYSLNITPDPFTTTVENVKDNFKCNPAAPNTGELRVRVYKAGVEVTDYTPYTYQWYTGGVASPVIINGATNYNITALDAGEYTVRVRDSQKGCDGEFVSGIITNTVIFPTVQIDTVRQTKCNPPNGSATATVTDPGGNLGYTFAWYDVGLNPLGITSSTAANLAAGNYKVIVSKSGCDRTFDALIKSPLVGDAEAQVVQHVEDCLNPESGIIQADVRFSGAIQDPTNYTFDWFYFNGGIKGSILPAAHGTGPTRTLLPVGRYLVEVTDNITGCKANLTPDVTITSATILPVASIQQVAPQTSCDINNPNGILTASATAGSYVSPNDFKFEWFKGDNTIGPVLTTVSGVKGETLNKVGGGGIFYTVKVTTPNNCSDTEKFAVAVDENEPVITLTQVNPNSVCDATIATLPYNGSVQASVTFKGVTVTLPNPNYRFTWYDGATTAVAHTPAPADLQNPLLSGLKDGDYTAIVERLDLACVSDPDTETVTKATVNPLLSATSTGSNNCDAALTPDGTVTVSVTNTGVSPGPFTYKWYDGNAVGVNPLGPANNGTSATAINVGGPTGAPRPYTVEVLNTATGCKNNTTQFVADNSVVPVLSSTTTDNTICAPAANYNGTFKILLTNPVGTYVYPTDFTFTWYQSNTNDPLAVIGGPTTTTNLADPSITLTKLQEGPYTVVGKNTKTGCTSAPASNVVGNGKVYPSLLPSATGSNNCSLALTPDGTASVAVSVTTGAHTFQWYTGTVDPVAAPGTGIINVGTNATATSQTITNVGGPNNPVGSAPHYYTVLVTHTATQCANFTTAAVPDNSVVPVLSTSTTPNDICKPATNFSGDMTVDVDNIPALYTMADYRFTWRNPALLPANDIIQGPSVSPLLDKVDAGTYTVVGENIKTGCVSAVATNNVGNAKVFPSLAPSSTGSNNCDKNMTPDGTATVVASGTTGGYTYQWYTGLGDPTATPFPGTLSVIATGTNATLLNVGGPNDPVGSAPRSYTVLVEDVTTGCQSYTSASVADVSVKPVLATATTPNTICDPIIANTNYSGTMAVTLSNAQPVGTYPTDFTFKWYTGVTNAPASEITGVNLTTTTGVGVITLTNRDVNSYTVEAVNTKTGCPALPATNQVANGKVNPSVSVTTTPSSVCTENIAANGTATGTVVNLGAGAGQTDGPFTLQWYDGAVVNAGDEHGAAITNNLTGTNTINNVGGPDLSASAPFVYTLEAIDTQTGCRGNSAGTVADISEKPTLTLTKSDNSICDPALITTGAAEYNGQVNITAVDHNGAPYGGTDLTYEWFDFNPGTSALTTKPGETATTLALVPAAQYAATVTITSLDCTSDPEVIEVLDNLPTLDIVPAVVDNTNCPGGLINANGSAAVSDITEDGASQALGNYTYAWFDGPIVAGPARGETSQTGPVQIQGPQTFTVRVTNNATGCRLAEAMTVTDVKVTPTITVALVQDNTQCAGDPNGELLATPVNHGTNFTISWTGGTGVAAVATTTIANDTYEKLAAGGPYFAKVRNNDTGCESQEDSKSILDDFTYPAIAIAKQDQTACVSDGGTANGMLTATSAGTVTYTWYTGLNTTVVRAQTAANSGIIDQLPAGDYTVKVVIDATGCFATESPNVQDVITYPTLTLTPTGATNCTNPNGSIAFAQTGLSSTTSYTLWVLDEVGNANTTDPATLQVLANIRSQNVDPIPDFINLAPGYFTAIIRDENTKCSSQPVNTYIQDPPFPSITIGTITAGTSCGVGSTGGVDATVAGGTMPYTFKWYNAAPSNTNITFIADPPTPANPPAMGVNPVIQATEDLLNVTTGVYTLVVTDAQGCGDYTVETVPALNFPAVTVQPANNTQCAPGQNGEVDVDVQGDPGVTYGITLYRGNDPTTATLVSGPVVGIENIANLFNGLIHDEYLVKIDDGNSPPCPIYKSAKVNQVAFNPVVLAEMVDPNTSCDPSNSGDGSIKVTVSSNPDPANAANAAVADFEVTSITAPPVGGFAPVDLNTGGNTTVVGFGAGSFTILVTDNFTGCTSTTVANINDEPITPNDIVVAPTAETNCGPNILDSNGSALATVAPGAATIYDFEWYQDLGLTTIVNNGIVVPKPGDMANTGGQLLNQSKVSAPAFWTVGADGEGSGNRTYFVRARTNSTAGAGNGVGCYTQVAQVVILDEHISPDMTLTPKFDSFCLATAANDGVGDGQIDIVADSDPAPGAAGNQFPAGGFEVTWDPFPSAATQTPTDVFMATASHTIGELGDGTYTVTVRNLTNKCTVEGTTTISPAPYVLEITDFSFANQRICNDDGFIEITEVTLTDNSVGGPADDIDSQPLGDDLNALYTFEWFTDASLTAGAELKEGAGGAGATIVDRILSNDANKDLVFDEPGDYQAMAAGTYYVRATRNDPNELGFGCPALPISVTIEDKHFNPVPTLTALSNTSCLPAGPGEGEIRIAVSDPTAAPFSGGNYTYTFIAPGPMPAAGPVLNPNNNPQIGDGVGGGNDDDFVELLDNVTLGDPDPYTISVTNNTTGCVVNAFATIIKNATPVFVKEVTLTDEINCFPTGDGSITVTRVSLQDRDNVSFDFVPTPGVGQGDTDNFDFHWTKQGDAFTQITTGANGHLLNSATYDATAPGFSTNIGAGTYTVMAERKIGSPGAGCKSVPFQVIIQDKKINPVVTMTPFSNTSCNTNFEGEIKIKVTDATTATAPFPLPTPFRFNYNWTASATVALPVGTVTMNNDGNEANNGDADHVTALQEGAYSIRATNSTTQCFADQSTTIVKNATPVFVQAVTVGDQVLCSPDGSIRVDKVSLNDRTGTSTDFTTALPNGGQNMLTDFQFEWTRIGDPNNFTLVMNGAVAPAGATLDNTNYVQGVGSFGVAFGAGKYTVVARRKAGSPGANCTSAPYTVEIQDKKVNPVVTLTPFANTSCSNNIVDFEGAIKVVVTDANSKSTDPDLFTYNWTASATPTVITGLQAGTSDGDGDASDLDDDNPTGLMEGGYAITVINTQTNCQTTGSTTIFQNSTPVITQLVDADDQIMCSNDGRLEVKEVKVIDRDGTVKNSTLPIGDPNYLDIADFDFEWSRTTTGNQVATGDGGLGAVSGGTVLDVGSYPTIGFDTYYVVTRRMSGAPGKNCPSAPYKVDILDKRVYPAVSMTPLANSSCHTTIFEGEIRVKVTDATPVAPPVGGFRYEYEWTDSATPLLLPVGTTTMNNDGDTFGGLPAENDGVGLDSDGDHISGLKENDPSVPALEFYRVTVTNQTTSCTSIGATQIFKNSTPVLTQSALSTPQIVCLNDGSITVQEVKVIDRDGNVESNLTGDFPLSDFAFIYHEGTIGNIVLDQLDPQPAVTLDVTSYPSVQRGTYYIVAKRTGGGPGLDCESAPYKVDIDDQRVYPTVAFNEKKNSSCSQLKPNGTLIATASERDATTDNYTFSWTLNGQSVAVASPTSIINNASPTSTITNALDGDYIVTATNTITGCPYDASFSVRLDQTMSTPNIIEVITIDPLDCNPTAQAEVTKITIGSNTNSSLIPPQANNEVTGPALLNFNYLWFKGTTNAADQYPIGGPFVTTPCIGPGCTTPTIGLTAGTYFVFVQDPSTDCQSGPKEVVINPDDIVYPVVLINQTQLQISCPITNGTGELQATADGQNSSNPNYQFEWFSTLDGTPPSVGNNSTLSNLVQGDYSVTATNLTTSCSTTELFIVRNQSAEFLPELSMSTDPRRNCLTPDGQMLVREVNYDPNSEYPFDPPSFTTELYVGSNADVTVPGSVMANVPGFNLNWSQGALDVGTYTIKITDNNTGCITVGEVSVEDDRTPPVIAIREQNPLTYCDPVPPNGVLEATADNGNVGGYTFQWHRGTTATPPIIQTSNLLIGERDGSFTVHVINDISGCAADKTGQITDAHVDPPSPDASVVQHQTRCAPPPDGWVTVSVDGVTLNYSFNWYDGATVTAPADFNGVDYTLRPAGQYTVTATDVVTGCVSDPSTVEVLEETVIPKMEFLTTASFCEDLPAEMNPGGNGTIQVQLVPADVLTDSVVWVKVEPNGATSDAGMGSYITGLWPGTYHAFVRTTKGCSADSSTVVPTEVRAYNLVTSNADQKNDKFVIDCISRFPNNNVKIFNRAGVKVFEIDGYNNDDKVFTGLGEIGVYAAGNELPVGTYFYIIDKRDGSRPRTGYLELVK